MHLTKIYVFAFKHLQPLRCVTFLPAKAMQIERLVECPPETISQLVELFRQVSQTANESLVSAAIASSQNQVLAARDDKKHIVGALIIAMTPCASGIRVHIEDVVVDSNWRRQGIATRLLREAIDRAVNDFKARTIDLTSRPDREAANRLYRKLGFTPRDTNVYRYTPN